jgi:hypothetical protein
MFRINLGQIRANALGELLNQSAMGINPAEPILFQKPNIPVRPGGDAAQRPEAAGQQAAAFELFDVEANSLASSGLRLAAVVSIGFSHDFSRSPIKNQYMFILNGSTLAVLKTVIGLSPKGLAGSKFPIVTLMV